MDPYIERPELWPDFHDRFVAALCGGLQPVLRPRYVALTQDRLFIVESSRPIRPDVAVVRTVAKARRLRGAALEVDTPAVFELSVEEVTEPLIHIVEPAAGNRVVTAIEVLSPDNKTSGSGRESYLKKREELWSGGASVVEIVLFRQGLPTVRLPAAGHHGLARWHYVVATTRRSPARQEIYAVLLQSRLPRIAVPLSEGEADAPLDLQAAFTRTWEEGPYPELLRYQGPPPGSLTDKERAWCEAQARGRTR